MVRKYPLPVSNIKRLTEDAVVVSFDIPDELKEEFKFKAGQYITFIIDINGEQVRRAYSLCSSPDEDKMSVGVKRIPNGKMSTYLNRELKEGEIVCEGKNVFMGYSESFKDLKLNNQNNY